MPTPVYIFLSGRGGIGSFFAGLGEDDEGEPIAKVWVPKLGCEEAALLPIGIGGSCVDEAALRMPPGLLDRRRMSDDAVRRMSSTPGDSAIGGGAKSTAVTITAAAFFLMVRAARREGGAEA